MLPLPPCPGRETMPRLRQDQHRGGEVPRQLAQTHHIETGAQWLPVAEAHGMESRPETADFPRGHPPPAHVEDREGSRSTAEQAEGDVEPVTRRVGRDPAEREARHAVAYPRCGRDRERAA